MEVLQIIRRHWYLLRDIPGCRHYPEVGYRKAQSLREILTGATFTQEQRVATISSIRGHYRCGQSSVCSMNIETKYLNFSDLGYRHKLHQFLNCKMKMCVNLLICKCNLRYVCSTCRQLRVRLQEHCSSIKHCLLEAPLTQHCLENGNEFNGFRCSGGSFD